MSQGQIAGQVNYVGRAFYTYTNSGTSQASDSSAWGALLASIPRRVGRKLSWGLDFSYREVDFNEGRSEFDQFNVAVADIRGHAGTQRLAARQHREQQSRQLRHTRPPSGWGGGLRWNPSPRTNLFLEYDQRVFGSRTSTASTTARRARYGPSAAAQGLSTGQRNAAAVHEAGQPGRPSTCCSRSSHRCEPDPVKRAQLVNDFLRANGIDPKRA